MPWNDNTDRAVAQIIAGVFVSGALGLFLFVYVLLSAEGIIESGDDAFTTVTVLALLGGLGAGAWLVAIGIRTLWRQRNSNGDKPPQQAD